MRHLSAVILILILAVAPSCNYFKNKGLFGKKAKTLEALACPAGQYTGLQIQSEKYRTSC